MNISTPVYLVDRSPGERQNVFPGLYHPNRITFQVEGTTLLITCEEGEEEYDEKELLKYHTVLENHRGAGGSDSLRTLRAFCIAKIPPGASAALSTIRSGASTSCEPWRLPPGWGICSGDRHRRRRQLSRSTVQQHAVSLHRDGAGCGYGDLQPL